MLAEYRRLFAGAGRVLDVGCGNNLLQGQLGPTLVVGVDLSAHSRTDVLGSALRLPFADGAFDGVIARDLIEHLPDPIAACREFARVLAPGGRLRIETPTEHYRPFWDDPTHLRPHSVKSVQTILEAAGLRPLAVRRFNAAGLPAFGRMGAEDLAMRINNVLSLLLLRRYTNIKADAEKPA